MNPLDWPTIAAGLNANGHAALGRVFDPSTCQAFIDAYDASDRYRNIIDMARYNFGRGQYKYFDYPLPEEIQRLRSELYSNLAVIANDWMARLKSPVRYPDTHAAFLAECYGAGQMRPTPLILSYGVDDYNCLHQDLYGDILFPLQVVIMLSDPDVDFDGGEFVMTEQRPRMQSRATVARLAQGEALVFAVNDRLVQGKSRPYRVKMRHGVSPIRRGRRFALGVIFHDAR